MMKSLSKLTLSAQMIAMGLIISIIASAGGIVSGVTIWTIEDQLLEYEEVTNDALISWQIDANLALLLNDAREYTSTHEEAEIDDVHQLISKTRELVLESASANHSDDRNEAMKKTAEDIDAFEKVFDRVVELIKERDRIVADELDKHGSQASVLLSNIADTSIREKDFEAGVLAGGIREHFLMARLHISNFLLSESKEHADRAESELAEITTRLDRFDAWIGSAGVTESESHLPAAVPVAGRAAIANMFKLLQPQMSKYRDAFASVRTVIDERVQISHEVIRKDNATIGARNHDIVADAANKASALTQQINSNVDTTHYVIILAITLCFIAAVWLSLANARFLSRRMSGIVNKMHNLANGDTNFEVENTEGQHEIGQLERALLVFRDAAIEKVRLEAEAADQRQRVEEETRKNSELHTKTSKIQGELITVLGEGLGRLARGDLTARMTSEGNDAFRQIKDDFNRMVEEMRSIAGRITEATGAVEGATRDISGGVADLSGRTEQQASALEETAASLEELSATVRQNAGNAQAANEAAVAARELATGSGNVADQAIGAMGKIDESSRQITEIVVLIEEIAFQTNILALNAAVEAARAGEAGRGFAVVANEVRSLAQRSGQALKEVKGLIANSDTKVKEGVVLVSKAGSSLKDIVTSVKKVAELVSEIAAASQEQSTGIEQVSRAVSNMDEMTQRNAALVEETNAALQSAQSQVEDLTEAVAFFKTGLVAKPMPAMAAGRNTITTPLTQTNPVHRQQSLLARKVATSRHAPTGASAAAIAENDDWKEF